MSKWVENNKSYAHKQTTHGSSDGGLWAGIVNLTVKEKGPNL